MLIQTKPEPVLRAGRIAAAGLVLAGLLAFASSFADTGAQPPGRSAPVAAQPQPPSQQSVLADWLAEPRINQADVGLIALPLSAGPPLIEHRSGSALNPASTIKLLTSHAALSMLGADYRWQTGAFLDGELRGQALHGNLVLKGGGDPKLVIEDLVQFVAQMRAAGLRELRGDLLIDDSIYDVGTASVDAFDDDRNQPYNVRPFGLLMNFKATRVVVQPAAGRPRITLDPALDGVVIENRLRVRGGRCQPGRDILSVTEARAPKTPSDRPGRIATARLLVSGTYTPACGEFGAFVSVLSHREFIDALFRAVWREAGGLWDGTTRIARGAAQGSPWLLWQSPRSLADVVHDINKFSNNVMSRQLLLQLGHVSGAQPSTLSAGREALRGWMAREGLSLPGLVLDNGSGLSRSTRISAAGMAQVLLHAAKSGHGDLLRESLPVLGIDGTMRFRMAGEPLAGRAWIKTGSLADVSTIAGYLDAVSGTRYAVVLFVNGPRPSGARRLQEEFLRWVYRHG